MCYIKISSFSTYYCKGKHADGDSVTKPGFGYPLYALLLTCSQRLLNYVAFQSFGYKITWWRLPQKRVVDTKLDIYVFIKNRK